MQRFKSSGQARDFLSAHAIISVISGHDDIASVLAAIGVYRQERFGSGHTRSLYSRSSASPFRNPLTWRCRQGEQRHAEPDQNRAAALLETS
jgi:hypothetical protein